MLEPQSSTTVKDSKPNIINASPLPVPLKHPKPLRP